MILKLFTQQNCPRCPVAKKIVSSIESKVKVEQYDITTEDGLGEGLQYDVMSTPSIIILNHDNEIVGEWRGESPTIDQLNNVLK